MFRERAAARGPLLPERLTGRPASRSAPVLAICAGVLLSCVAAADEVRVAVAANFVAVAERLSADFSQRQGDTVRLHAGSSGQLFAQITQGAPYDVFLSADAARPEALIERELAVPGTAFAYAFGRLVLWSRAGDGELGPVVLDDPAMQPIAIANPALAPYGAAALDVLERLGAANGVKLVRGNSITQAFQFVAAGHAPLGFVARSQLHDTLPGARWLVPAHLHRPIAQYAVLLGSADDRAAAAAFLDFLRSDGARRLIVAAGYDLAASDE